MAKKLPEQKITEEQFNAMPHAEKVKFITGQAAQVADLLLLNIEKWKHPHTVKCLGLLLASVILHKMGGHVSNQEYINTVEMYLNNIKIQQPSGQKEAVNGNPA